MNAILRADCEAIVLTNEAIEVHLSYLRPTVEALGDKLDQLNKKLDDRLGEVNKKIENLDEKLDDKLGEMNQTINRHDKEHIERVSRIQASLDGLKWFVSSATILATGMSIAHSLGWI